MLYLALAITVSTLVWVYTRPPTRSSTALRKRIDGLEELTDADHMELKRLVKRYRRLEGHVYGSIEPGPEEVAEPDGLNPALTPGSGTLALLPDADFPEEEFQRLVAQRRGSHV